MWMKRIILADDHSFVRLGLVQILKDEYPSVEIKQVGDGESLVKEVTLHDWDLVISDLDMPGRNGLEALEQIIETKQINNFSTAKASETLISPSSFVSAFVLADGLVELITQFVLTKAFLKFASENVMFCALEMKEKQNESIKYLNII